jgi:integrase/recombinase XerD
MSLALPLPGLTPLRRVKCQPPPVRCHQLRHTCLTRLREAGMALEAVQPQAGHRGIESTRVYLHLANDWLAGEYLRAAALIDADAGAVGEMLATQEAAGR